MPQERVSVRKIKETLRLSYELKLNQSQIASSCHIGQASVFRYLKRFKESGMSWPLPADCDDRILEELLFSKPGPPPQQHPMVDFAAVERQLQAHKHLSLQLLWKNTAPLSRRATSTAISVRCTASGKAARMWCCGRTTAPVRSCLWTGPAQAFRFTMPALVS